MVLAAPQNLQYIGIGKGAVFYWTPVYNATKYKIDITYSKNDVLYTTSEYIYKAYYKFEDSALGLSIGNVIVTAINNSDISLPTTLTAINNNISLSENPLGYNTPSVNNIVVTGYTDSLVFTWSRLTTIFPISYQIKLYTTPPGTSRRVSIRDATTTDTYIAFGNLQPNTTYYPRIDAIFEYSIIQKSPFSANTTSNQPPQPLDFTIYNSTLSTFTVNGDPAYNTSIFILPTGTTSVTVVATPASSTATVTKVGETGLTTGLNTLTVTCTDGSSSTTYTVTLYVEPAAAAVCFLSDAPVLTPQGYTPICDICVGDSVVTAEGRTVVVKRVFKRSYSPSAAVNPYVIPKGMFGATRSFAISPNQEVIVPGRGMMKAKELGLRRMKMTDDFMYYNLELEDWVRDNLVVAGVAVESLAPAKRVTMTKAEFAAFVKARYGSSAAARLRLPTVCFEESDGHISMPALL